MKKSIVAGLLLIFVSFSIMAENIGNMPSSVNEVKSGNEILLKCLNIVGESTQGTEITEKGTEEKKEIVRSIRLRRKPAWVEDYIL